MAAYLAPAVVGGRAYLAPAVATAVQQPTVTAPGVPRNVVATPGINSISAAFQAPISDGGAAITGYPVRLSTGEQKTVTSSPAVFTGLSAGVARTAQVAASNAQYTGPYSAASNSAAPTAPVVVTPPAGTIGDVAVPASRTVVFPGTSRVVTFPASIRAVVF